jgi:phospholipase/carboxylesterase
MDSANNELVIDGWTMRVRRPAGVGPFPVILLLHGWTGDENSMWVFASRLPMDAMLIAPRALYPATSGGYSWHPPISKPWPLLDDFQNAVEKIFTTISRDYFPDGDFSNLHLMGFSQGAALAYSMAIIKPERVTSLAGLSGFLPDGASAWLSVGRLQGMVVFVAHGTQDERVPVDKARMSVELLEHAGALVTYCEDNVGHKLSAKCFHGLEAFYQKINC